MASERKVTKCYMLTPPQVAVIIEVAKNHGQCSESAALRLVIDEYVKVKADKRHSDGG